MMVRRSMRGWLFSLGALTSLMIISGLAYQNCAPAPSNEMSQLQKLAQEMPFAYTARFDQLAYMSCSDTPTGSYDKGAYFSFRLGAYGSNAGLKLNDDFKNQAGKFPEDNQKTLLGLSALNSQTQLQVGIRSVNDLQAIFTASGGGGAPIPNSDYMNMLGVLGEDIMNDALIKALKDDTRVRYVRDPVTMGPRMEGSLYFLDSYVMAGNLRNFLSNDGILAATYALGLTKDQSAARGPADYFTGMQPVGRSVYGKGLMVTFRQPTLASLNGQFPQNTLASVTEVSLEDRSKLDDIGQWTCPVELQFRIIRPEDLAVAGANCTVAADPDVYTDNLTRVRNALRVEDWYVDMTNRCVVPKKYQVKNCYGDITTVRYDTSQICAVGANNSCIHMVSICYREN